MQAMRFLPPRFHPAALHARPGITLLEVLVAIFIMGVGMLAILTLFPLGALEMAQAIQDDRAAHAAEQAVALSEAGEELLGRTREFVVVSALQGSADPKTVLVLRADYSDLGEQAAEMEAALRDVRPVATTAKSRRIVDRLLLQIRSIKLGISAISGLLGQLGGGIPTDLITRRATLARPTAGGSDEALDPVA